jgi:hypothetical protein
MLGCFQPHARRQNNPGHFTLYALDGKPSSDLILMTINKYNTKSKYTTTTKSNMPGSEEPQNA